MPSIDSRMNCVLYFITSKELEGFDEREIGYERIDVTDKVEEYSFEGTKVYAYKALEDNIYHPKKSNENSVIAKYYVDLVSSACDSISVEFRKEYDASTNPFPQNIVAPFYWSFK